MYMYGHANMQTNVLDNCIHLGAVYINRSHLQTLALVMWTFTSYNCGAFILLVFSSIPFIDRLFKVKQYLTTAISPQNNTFNRVFRGSFFNLTTLQVCKHSGCTNIFMNGGHGNEQLTKQDITCTCNSAKIKQKYKHKILLIFFSTNKLSTQVEYWLVKTEQNGEKGKKLKK